MSPAAVARKVQAAVADANRAGAPCPEFADLANRIGVRRGTIVKAFAFLQSIGILSIGDFPDGQRVFIYHPEACTKRGWRQTDQAGRPC